MLRRLYNFIQYMNNNNTLLEVDMAQGEVANHASISDFILISFGVQVGIYQV